MKGEVSVSSHGVQLGRQPEGDQIWMRGKYFLFWHCWGGGDSLGLRRFRLAAI